jgi:uncharacterized membrane protein
MTFRKQSPAGSGPATTASFLRWITTAAACTLLWGCGEVLPTAREDEAPIVVRSAIPAEGDQGRTLQVRVIGEGFTQGVEATWNRNGAVSSAVLVGSVQVLSSTELLVTIEIAPGATLGVYDVVVRKRKKGIGTEFDVGTGPDLFRVNQYTPSLLGTLGSGLWAGDTPYSTAAGLNNHGVLVGGSGRAVYWTAAEGIKPFGGIPGYAHGINDRGWIVGVAGERNDQVYTDPFIYENQVLTQLRHLSYPHPSIAWAINDAGTIVGQGSKDYWRDPTWPIVWRRGADGSYGPPLELPLRNGEQWKIDDHMEGSLAMAINTRGDVVGMLRYGQNPPYQDIAVLWRVRPDGSYEAPLELGGTPARATAINDAGWIVGQQAGRSVLWHPSDYSKAIPIGTHSSGIWSEARSINRFNQVVGHVDHADGFLWKLDGAGQTTEVLRLLPSDGYRGARPYAINDMGWVVGWSEVSGDRGMRFEATLWRPDR